MHTRACPFVRARPRLPEVHVSPHRPSQHARGGVVHGQIFGPVHGPRHLVVGNGEPFRPALIGLLPRLGVQHGCQGGGRRVGVEADGGSQQADERSGDHAVVLRNGLRSRIRNTEGASLGIPRPFPPLRLLFTTIRARMRGG